MRFAAIILLSALNCSALVPFFNNPAYERDEPVDPPWWVHNNGKASHLYLNGVYQSKETGTNDLALEDAWKLQPDALGVTVGIIDMHNGHGDRISEIVFTVAPYSDQIFVNILRWGVPSFVNGICYCVSNGCRIIVMAEGFSFNDEGLSNACRYAESKGVVICCAVPNVDGDMDTDLVDYPYSYARVMRNILPVTSTDRNGQHYHPSGTGTNCIAAPGRNITAYGTYSSGTSYATPIVAGCLALLARRHPEYNAQQLIARAMTTATVTPEVRRIAPRKMLKRIPEQTRLSTR